MSVESIGKVSRKELGNNKENKYSQHNLIFEPGKHIKLDSLADIRYFDLRWNKDWYNTHRWNQEVGFRMSRSGVKVLGIDSLSYNSDYSRTRTDYNRRVWELLPTNPNSINPNDSLLLPVVDFSIDFAASIHDPNLFAQLLDFENRIFDKYRESDTKPVMILMLGSMISLAHFINSKQKNKEKNTDGNSKDKRPTRREFLKYIAAFTVVDGVTSASPKTMKRALESSASFTIDTDTKERLVNLHNRIATLDLYQESLVDGRTAAVIQRAFETVEFLDLPNNATSAVIMGAAHLNRANEYLSSEAKRLESIRKLLNELKKLASLTAESFEIDKNEFVGTIMNNFTTIQIYEVHDPKNKSDDPSESSLTENISLLDEFESPSTRRLVNDLKTGNI